MPEQLDTQVAIVGAGFGGLAMAHALRQEGFEDFVVLERADGLGGTWRDNTYPGATCDVPSVLYSYSFAPNAAWRRSFSPQPEILEYLERCTDELGLRPHIRFGHEVTSSRWDEGRQRWELTTTAGELNARVLVSARGPLSEPRLPDIAGTEAFQGTMFHSARWNHEHDLRGEKVAVIGTGASAAQFVPWIQPLVKELTLFQRTPPWVLPRHDRRLSGAEQRLYRSVPLMQRVARGAVYWGREAYVLAFAARPSVRRRLMNVARRQALRQLEAQVPDPTLRALLTPQYQMGCKRIVISSDYYPALIQPNVQVVGQGVAELRAHSVVAADGSEHAVDTVIFGTGFDVTAQPTAEHTYGRDGRSLAEAWSGRMEAHRGTTVAGFPNLFLIVGPNTGLGHTSIIFVIESQIAYVMDCLRTMRRQGLASVEVRHDAQEAWNLLVEARGRDTVWTAGDCHSYYLDRHGRNIGIWPGSSWALRRSLRRFDAESFHLLPRRATDVPALLPLSPRPEATQQRQPVAGGRPVS